MIRTVRHQTIISHSRPFLGEEESAGAAEVIRFLMLSQGAKVEEFESRFCGKFGYRHAAAVSSGTSALHLALLAMGVQPGTEVIIPSYVCSALLNAVRYVGALPVAADSDPDTYNIDPSDIEKKITAKTKAIIVAHMFGLAADMDRILKLGIPVIEDCAQAVGAAWAEKPVGLFGQAAVFSFYATKVMTTGEGGMVVSHSQELMDKVKDLRDYDQKNDDKLRYNYKMTDIQAAIGIAQLDRLDFFIDQRRKIARNYSDAFNTLDFQAPGFNPGHIYFRYVIKLNIKADASEWIDRLKDRGIGCERPVFKPIHQYLGLKGFRFTDDLYHRLISIPIYPKLSDEETGRVIQAVTENF